MPARIQEIQDLLKEGKTLLLSAKITVYGKDDKDNSISITAIYNQRITNSSKQTYITMGVSFSPKKFLNELAKLEQEGKLKVRKAGNIYLIDGEDGKVYATVNVEDENHE